MPAGMVTIVSFPQHLGEKGAERIQASKVLFSSSQAHALSIATLLFSVISPWRVGWCMFAWVMPGCDGSQGLGVAFLAGSPIVLKFQHHARLGSGGGQGHRWDEEAAASLPEVTAGCTCAWWGLQMLSCESQLCAPELGPRPL